MSRRAGSVDLQTVGKQDWRNVREKLELPRNPKKDIISVGLCSPSRTSGGTIFVSISYWKEVVAIEPRNEIPGAARMPTATSSWAAKDSTNRF